MTLHLGRVNLKVLVGLLFPAGVMCMVLRPLVGFPSCFLLGADSIQNDVVRSNLKSWLEIKSVSA